MNEAIHQRLIETENRFDIRILYAAEMGSRAWGFANPESDYDVRFIYVHRMAKYLSIDGLGVLTLDENNGLPIENNLDFVGWDLPKMLDLARRSNPQVLEWLNSPIVYKKIADIYDIAALTKDFFCPATARRYYWSIVVKNLNRYIDRDKGEHGGDGKISKYLHTIRPLLMVRWLEKFQAPNLPINLDHLRQQVSAEVPTVVQDEIVTLQRDHKEGREYPKIIPAAIDKWIVSELDRWERDSRTRTTLPHRKVDLVVERERVNTMFRAALANDHFF